MQLPIGRGIALVAVTFAAAACMTSHDVITGSWTLVGVNGSTPVAEGALSLLPDGTFTMRPGCNTGGGTYVVSGNRLETDALNSTMMACEAAVMAQEEAFVGVLEADPRYEIETGTGRLKLTAGDSSLVFVTP